MSHNGAAVSPYISANSDNRRFCIPIQRQKFCYDTLEKAQKACDYSSNPQRPYYCDFCQAYHTTHCMDIDKRGAINYAQKVRGLKRKINKNKKILYLRHFDNPTRAMVRAFNKDYRQVIKKYLVDYLDATRDEVALSDEALKNGLRSYLLTENEIVLRETGKWPFCDLRSAMIFYAFYWLQVNNNYVGKTASDLVDLLFIESDYSIELKDYFEKVFKKEWIVLIGGVEYNGIYALGAFNDEVQNAVKEISIDVLVNTYAEGDKMIAAARDADYHPAIKELLLKHLVKHIDNTKMLQGESLSDLFSSGVLVNPTDETVKLAINETLRWRFVTERKACQFLMLYYLSISDPVFVMRLGDIVNDLFVQGNRPNRFMKNIKSVLYKLFEDGEIVISGMCLGAKKYRLV